ncbi:MAG: (d)CMP kinase [Eubacterium sp.]
MYNIAIDGPAGAGKSTIAKIVAKKLGYIYVDTGAMYRTMALACIRAGIDKFNEKAVVNVCKEVDISIRYVNSEQVVLLNGENVNGYIRTEEVGNTASAIAVYKDVRNILVALQQQLAAKENIVMDGRDIGTAVLPNADVKIYLTASAHTRALRRMKELLEKGVECSIEEIEKDIIERDNRDMNRKESPLVKAEDAQLVDSSEMTIDEVVDTIISLCR